MKKGIEYLEVPNLSIDGLTTLWTVDKSLLFVNRSNISPTFITNSSSFELIGIHLFCFVRISRPSALAPIKRVIKFMSPCAAALTAPSDISEGSNGK